MTSPAEVDAFYSEYDVHAGDRIRLFAAVASHADAAHVLYAGSYVDVAPSVHFGDVTYVDNDRRAARWFDQHDDVGRLITRLRVDAEAADAPPATFRFIAADYRDDLEIDDESVELLVSLYGGFVSEHCARYLAPGGRLLANNSHGDASMASLDPRFALDAVVTSGDGAYRARSDDLDRYLVPKRGEAPTVEALHSANRGVAYTASPYAYLFRRLP